MGREHCAVLSAHGLHVAVNDVDEAAAREVTAQVCKAGGDALAFPADVADRVAVEHAVAEIAAAWGGIDVLVSNAGTMHSGRGLMETDDSDWTRTLAVHLGGCLNVTRACMPWLRQSPSPRIIVVGSLWGQRGEGHSYAYVAAKGALAAFARNLAVEFGDAGVCVNVIAPGSVPTRMAADYSEADIAEDCRRIPLGRWGTVQEMAAVIAFLASEQASYITGQTIAVNGGQLICGS